MSEEPACLTQTVESREADRKNDFPKESQLELESFLALARENEDLGKEDAGQKHTLEVITEIPEDAKSALSRLDLFLGFGLWCWFVFLLCFLVRCLGNFDLIFIFIRG